MLFFKSRLWLNHSQPTFLFLYSQASNVFAVIVMTTVISLSSFRYPFMYSGPWKAYAASMCLPLVALTAGFVVPKLFRMSNAYARTVAMETSMQNAPLCFGVITLSFPKGDLPKIILIPLIGGLMILSTGISFTLVYRLVKKIREGKTMKHAHKETEQAACVELMEKA